MERTADAALLERQAPKALPALQEPKGRKVSRGITKSPFLNALLVKRRRPAKIS
jgi:hypothetical protein